MDAIDQAQKPADGRTTIGLAEAESPADAAVAALSVMEAEQDLGWPERLAAATVVPRRWNDADARALAGSIGSWLRAAVPSAPVSLLRTPGVAGQFAAAAREAWRDVELGPGAERFDRVRAPTRLLESTRVALAPVGWDDVQAARPIAIASAFAHPRQRAVARLAANDPALLAELAAPLLPHLTLAVARTPGGWRVTAAADPIAAELSWLALAALAGRPFDVVAWQDPGVQRLAVMRPTVNGPADIGLAAAPTLDAAIVRSFSDLLGLPIDRKPRQGFA